MSQLTLHLMSIGTAAVVYVAGSIAVEAFNLTAHSCFTVGWILGAVFLASFVTIWDHRKKRRGP